MTTSKTLPEGYRNMIAAIVEAHSLEAVLAALVSVCAERARAVAAGGFLQEDGSQYLAWRAVARNVGQAEHAARMKGL